MARFFLRYRLKAKNINDLEQELDTGDVVLLSGEEGRAGCPSCSRLISNIS